MRLFILVTVLALGAATGFLTASVPAQAEYAVCIPARGCVPATQSSYNGCFQLALQRGWNASDNAERGGARKLDWFIYQCLAGRIPK